MLEDVGPPADDAPRLFPIRKFAPGAAREKRDHSGAEPRVALVLIAGDAEVAGEDGPAAFGGEVGEPICVSDVG